MKNLIFALLILSALPAHALNKVQKQGIKNSAECLAAGATDATCLPEDAQVYLTTLSKRLDTAITAQDFVKNLTTLSFLSNTDKVTTFQGSASATSSVTYTLPTADGTTGQVLATNGSGVLSWAAPGGSSSWTENGSDIYFNTGNVGIGLTNPSASLEVKSQINLAGATSGHVGIKAANAAGSTVFTLPTADGSNQNVLVTNGSAQLSFLKSILNNTDTSNNYTLHGALVNCSTGSCSIVASDGTWFSVTRPATGQATLTWSANVWAADPFCNATVYNYGGCNSVVVAGRSSGTNITFQVNNTAGSGIDCGFMVMCYGIRGSL